MILTLLATVSCGKEKKDGHTLVINKGSGRLMLENASEVLEFRQKIDAASIDDKVLLSDNIPDENYMLVIEDIEDGDYVEFVEADISSWLSTKQKELVKDNKGCLKVTFYGSTYFPETQEKDAFFAPGDIAFESSLSCN